MDLFLKLSLIFLGEFNRLNKKNINISSEPLIVYEFNEWIFLLSSGLDSNVQSVVLNRQVE